MQFFTTLPLRQKILFILTICFGSFISFGVTLDIISLEQQKTCIYIFSIGLPTSLLLFDTIIDLDTPPIFILWLVIATICFVVCILQYGNQNYFVTSLDITSFKSKFVTSALKTPLAFLTLYYFLNKLNKKIIHHPIVNTFHAKTFHHGGQNRTIRASDIVFNIILYATIFISALFGL